MGNAADAKNLFVAVFDQQFDPIQGSPVIIRADIRKRSILKIAVDQDDGGLFVDLFEALRPLAARNEYNAVDAAGQQRIDTLAFVTFILKRIEQYHGVAVPLGFKDDFTGDRSEIRVVDTGDQQPDRVGFIGAQTLCKNTRLVIDAFGFVHYPLDGFRADAILFVLAVQHPRNSRNRNSSASGNTFQVILWTHSRIKFLPKIRELFGIINIFLYPCEEAQSFEQINRPILAQQIAHELAIHSQKSGNE